VPHVSNCIAAYRMASCPPRLSHPPRPMLGSGPSRGIVNCADRGSVRKLGAAWGADWAIVL
jgi:hypothetical protein